MPILAFLRDNAPWLTAGVLLTFLSSFGQTYFISIFAGEIRESFGLSHGQWGGIYMLGTTASALVMVWAGGLTDLFRVRRLAPLVLLLMVGACLFMAANPVWWLLPLVIFALRFTGQGMLSHLAVVAMARWFVAARGKALSVATLGFALGEAFLPLIFVSLLAIYDWRLLWVGAALVATLGIPLLLVLLAKERTPQSWAESSQSLGMDARHWTRRQTLRHSLFWFMVPALLGPSAFNTAFFFHQVHIAEVKGLSHVALVAMFPAYTAVGIGAMILSGWALDRLGTARLLPFMQLPMVAAFLLFAVSGGPGLLLLGFVCLALTTGANSTLPNAFWAEFYGTAHLGSIKAMAAAVMVLGSAIGPGLTGLGIDLGLGIETQFVLIAGYFVFASVMMTIGVLRARGALTV
ncbi:Major facilitator superfamily MFS_1 [Roseovarius sp. EC-HK134]|uniref:MFS transporter n=1 Tax=unclassified Roseovarius TaxID=2614913 RepID=UPI001255C5F7|nr:MULTISPECIES: MFS transporter [unclassified Roseovarius]VVT09678.1 Major facilitator superfamily MFS_1 [Roseovarius sp. EC-HK134]VVT09930.1 Major facilitator superfamily MFS_1 [Roseovarius sp. EC-SD190]